jgi:hypothetical protein
MLEGLPSDAAEGGGKKVRWTFLKDEGPGG